MPSRSSSVTAMREELSSLTQKKLGDTLRAKALKNRIKRAEEHQRWAKDRRAYQAMRAVKLAEKRELVIARLKAEDKLPKPTLQYTIYGVCIGDE